MGLRLPSLRHSHLLAPGASQREGGQGFLERKGGGEGERQGGMVGKRGGGDGEERVRERERGGGEKERDRDTCTFNNILHVHCIYVIHAQYTCVYYLYMYNTSAVQILQYKH